MSNPKAYLARGGRFGADESACLDRSLSIIGFTEVPSLKGCNSYEEILETLRLM